MIPVILIILGLTNIITVLWLSGVVRRLDQVETLARQSETTIATVQHITYEEKEGIRSIWGRSFDLIRCVDCGDPFATAEQLAFQGVPEEDRSVCPRCRRARLGRKFTPEGTEA